MDSVKEMLKLIKVYDCEFNKIRIGDNYDGGYVGLKKILPC